jgi:hypothetical protein
LLSIREWGGIKSAFYPIVDHKDVCSPTVSKFGGSTCKLPSEAFPSCCGENHFINICQLFIPTLPDEVQKLFPESKRNCLVVYQICSECLSLDAPIVRLYSPENFEKLEYTSSDLSIQPSRVLEWKSYESMMQELQLTYLSQKLVSEGNSSFFLESDPDKYHSYFFDTFRKHFENIHPKHNTNVGAFPNFVQEDETPKGFIILANFEQDEVCDLMWGDAGTAQLWVKTEGNNVELKATWGTII